MTSMDFSEFGISWDGRGSWGLQSFSGDFNSWTLRSWQGAGGTAAMERAFRSLGGEEAFFHRHEVILRSGEMPPGVHLILEGELQVLASGAFSETHTAQLVVGCLEPGETLALPWLEKRPSRFSFRVQSKSVTSILLSGPDITAKAESFFRERLQHKETAREDLWEASAWQQFEERARSQEELDARQKARMDWSGLKTRDGYLIPPECLMACHPNLRSVTPRRAPPPPVVTKSLPEIQREQRIAKMDEKDRPKVVKPKKKEDLDLSSLLSMDGGHRAGFIGGKLVLLSKPGDVFHPKTSMDANIWRRSEAYRFCQHFSVWQPELTEEDRRQGEALAAQEAQELADRNLRQSMGRLIGVLMQAKRLIKAGVASRRAGTRIRDSEEFVQALAQDETEKLKRNDVADAITGLGVADEEVEELVAQMDAENTGQIDREELQDALISPKRSVKQIYRKLRNNAVGTEADSWFSSDCEESERLLDLESSEDVKLKERQLSPKRFSLALPPEQEKPESAAYNALPARPLSAPIRGKVIEKPLGPKPIGKFHAMQRRLRRRQLRKTSSGHSEFSLGGPRILMETALLDDEKSSRLPPSSTGTLAVDATTPKH